MKKLNFTLNKMLSFLDNIGFMLLGTAVSLWVGSPTNVPMATKFALLGGFSLLASFLLGLMNSDTDDNTDCTKVVFVKKVKKKTKKSKKRRKK